MFWSIYIYDRELVYPKLLDNFIPAWLNHGMHTTVLPFVLIEMRTTHHQYPSRSCGLAAVCTFAVGYILWVCWIHHVTGVWVYPLLEHLSPGVKIIFFAAVTVIINVFYLVGEVLNNYIWDTQKCIEEGREKPKSEWTIRDNTEDCLRLHGRFLIPTEFDLERNLLGRMKFHGPTSQCKDIFGFSMGEKWF